MRGREREKERREKEKGGERIQSRLCSVSVKPDAGLDLLNCEIITKIKSQVLN